MRSLVQSMLTLFITLMMFSTMASANVFQGEEMDVELVSESVNVVPGETLWVAVRLNPTEGWHTYSIWPGDSGDATMIHDWELPAGATAGAIQWPIPEWLPFPGTDLVTFSYKEEVFLPVPIQVPADYSAATFAMSTHVEWQVCDLICLIGDAVVHLELPVQGNSLQPHPQWADAFEHTRANTPTADHALDMLFAVAGDRISFSATDNMNAGVFNNVSEAWFFPELRRVMRPGPLRDVMLTDAHAQITHNQHRRFLSDIEEIPGLLKLAYADGSVRGFHVNAEKVTTENLAAITAAATAASQSGSGGGGSGVFSGAGSQNVLVILAFALVGGLILNLMPCVFPVLSLKVLNLATKSESSAQKKRLHGLAYTAGVVAAFMLLASVLLALRAGGEAVGWAFQLQSPWFVALLVYLFFIMGLSLSGVYEFGTRFMGLGGSLTDKSGYKGSFFTGVLATVVASPCTAPFMGAALGFALAQTWVVAMTVFIALGVGMASPFLLLAFVPRLLKFMPKPGQWMVTFKELLAFPLYATALWLLWVLGMQVGITGMMAVAGSALLLGLALWLMQQRQVTSIAFLRTANAVIALVLVVGALAALRLPVLTPGVASAGSIDVAAQRESYIADYEVFSALRVEELRASGTPVLVNMTAAWCITCLANETTTLSTRRVQQALKDHNVTYMKGDWTNQDPEISRVLDEFSRPSVPLYILYPGDLNQPPTLLPQILTPSLVIDAVAGL